MNIVLTYTLIVCKEITVEVPDDSPNPALDAVRIARKQTDVVNLRSAIIDVKREKGTTDDRLNATTAPVN